MSEQLKAGDRVEWNTSQGKTTGRVKRKLTAPTDIKGHHIAASDDDPQYVVVSEKSGEEAAHKPDALRKL
jgi:hypothetical protein